MNTDETISYPAGCREISGFGGEYEACCRQMVINGYRYCMGQTMAYRAILLDWAGSGFAFSFSHSFPELAKSVLQSALPYGGATGAMFEAACSHIIYAVRHEWDGYIKEMQKEAGKGQD